MKGEQALEETEGAAMLKDRLKAVLNMCLCFLRALGGGCSSWFRGTAYR